MLTGTLNDRTGYTNNEIQPLAGSVSASALESISNRREDSTGEGFSGLTRPSRPLHGDRQLMLLWLKIIC